MVQTLHVRAGENFIVPLEGIPTTGFRWEVEISPAGGRIVSFVGEQVQANSFLPGAPAVQVFEFHALAAGETKLVFRYRRQWEKTKPRDERVVSVRIKPSSSS